MADIGTAIIGGSSVLGGVLGGNAAEDAAEIQARSAGDAQGEARRQYDLTRADLAPYRQTGGNALSQLSQLLGLSKPGESLEQFSQRYNQPVGRDWLPQERANINAAYQQYQAGLPPASAPLLKKFGAADFIKDPGYEFRLGEGSKAVERSAAARGMQLSGATLKALQRYNQDFASNEYSNAWNRDNAEKQRTFNSLASVAGIGQQATNTVSQVGQNTAANVGNAMMQQGNALASGEVGSANALFGGIQGAYDAYQYNNLMKNLFPKQQTSWGRNSMPSGASAWSGGW